MKIPPLKIFIIYAHEDRDYKNELLKSLKLLQKNGLVEAWHDRDLVAGDDWDKVIRGHLEAAHIILPIISIDFFNSDYIEQVEIEEAFRRYEKGEAHILPVIARQCKWIDDPRISKLQALPENGLPIAKWHSRDDAFDSVYDGIKAKIVEIQESWRNAERAKSLAKEDHATFAAARTRADFEAYLKKHTLHAAEARQKIEAFKKEEEKKAAEKAHREATERQKREEEASAKNIPEMFLIKGGSFDMGDTFGEGFDREKPAHKVTLGDFYLGKYVVTIAQFKAFIEDSGYQTDADKAGSSYIWNEKKSEWVDTKGANWRCDVNGKVRPESEHNHPVIHVSWNDAEACADWYSKKTGLPFRLPTEAEWEYAAREGGKKIRFGNGKDIADPTEINFDGRKNYKQPYSVVGEYRQKTAPVDSFQPNALGLYQMSGNVWEWCEDWYHSNYEGAPADGSAWLSPAGSLRVGRGGSWGSGPRHVRAAYRDGGAPGDRNFNIGFRLARTK